MTDEEKIKDYDRLKYEYTQLHQEYRRLSEQVKKAETRKANLTIPDVSNWVAGIDRTKLNI